MTSYVAIFLQAQGMYMIRPSRRSPSDRAKVQRSLCSLSTEIAAN